jgi:hypothetical protein
MTIDESIKHCEEVMMENLEKTKDKNASDPIAISCGECADNHRQLMEWLKELKAHREAWGKAKRTVKAYLMLEGFGSAYQDDIENLIEGCIPKDRGAE